MKDLQDWARQAGLTIHFPPAVFPVNSVKAMRGCLLLEPEGKLVPFARGIRGLLDTPAGHLAGDRARRAVRARRRRAGALPRRHRHAADQGCAQGQHG